MSPIVRIRVHNEEKGLGELDTHKICWMQETASNLSNGHMYMVGRTGTKRLSKKINFTKG